MKPEHITMALFFINRYLQIEKIENNEITIQGFAYPVQPLISNYLLICKGKAPEYFLELYESGFIDGRE
jgi:hypothetical protein